MVEMAAEIRHSRGLWCIDNVAALMALVKGTSNSASLDQMAKVIHLASFALGVGSYYEYVESKANWPDEISRRSLSGMWANRNGFTVETCEVASILLQLPCIAVFKVFTYL